MTAARDGAAAAFRGAAGSTGAGPPLSDLPAGRLRRALYRGQAAACRRELSNLLEDDEHHAVDFFVRLVVETAVALGVGRTPLWARMSPDSATCPGHGIRFDRPTPERLRRGWVHWSLMWQWMCERNPRLALADLMSEVGEAIDHRSWPFGRELELLDWIDRDERLPLPWPSRGGRDWSENAYELLRDTRLQVGGWILHDDALGRRVFRTDAEVAAIRAVRTL